MLFLDTTYQWFDRTSPRSLRAMQGLFRFFKVVVLLMGRYSSRSGSAGNWPRSSCCFRLSIGFGVHGYPAESHQRGFPGGRHPGVRHPWPVRRSFPGPRSQILFHCPTQSSVYKGYKQDKKEMIDLKYRIEWQIDKSSNFPLYLYMVAGGSDCCNHDVSGFSFIVKFNAVPVVQII